MSSEDFKKERMIKELEKTIAQKRAEIFEKEKIEQLKKTDKKKKENK